MKLRINWSLLAGLSAAVVLAVNAANASIIELDDSRSGSTAVPYTVSNTDLLQTSLSSLAAGLGNWTVTESQTCAGYPVLNDGTFGGTGSDYASSASAGLNMGGRDITYTLDTSVNTLGYDLTEIATYSGWGDNGRQQQSYTVSYSTVSAPTTFTDIKTVLYSNPTLAYPNSYDKVSLTDSTGMIASGVKSVKFTFNATANNWTGYRELDVIGSATVPEPGTLALLAFGSLAVLRRRKKGLMTK